MLKIDCKITAIVYSAKVDELCMHDNGTGALLLAAF